MKILILVIIISLLLFLQIKIFQIFFPKIKTTTSKVYDYALGNSKEIPLKHLCLPIWYMNLKKYFR